MPVDPICVTVNEGGLKTRLGAAKTVRFTVTTTGLLGAWERMVMAPVYGPGERFAKFTSPMVMLPGVLPIAPARMVSQGPPDCVEAVAV